MDIKGEFPEEIEFINEMGVLVKQPVVYEWKPIHCKTCGKMGHTSDYCRKVEQKKEWKVKQRVPQQEIKEPGNAIPNAQNEIIKGSNQPPNEQVGSVEENNQTQTNQNKNKMPQNKDGQGQNTDLQKSRIYQKVGNPVSLKNSFAGLQMVDEIQFGEIEVRSPGRGKGENSNNG